MYNSDLVLIMCDKWYIWCVPLSDLVHSMCDKWHLWHTSVWLVHLDRKYVSDAMQGINLLSCYLNKSMSTSVPISILFLIISYIFRAWSQNRFKYGLHKTYQIRKHCMYICNFEMYQSSYFAHHICLWQRRTINTYMAWGSVGPSILTSFIPVNPVSTCLALIHCPRLEI